jgi:hypothetical protein
VVPIEFSTLTFSLYIKIAVSLIGSSCDMYRSLGCICFLGHVCFYVSRTELLRKLFEAEESRDSSVGIASGYGLDDVGVGVRVSVGSIFVSFACAEQFCGPPSLLYCGYRRLFPRELSGRGVKLTTHLQLVPRGQEYLVLCICSPLRLHGIELN